MSDFDDNLFYDFVTNYVIVPVSDNYNYKTRVRLDNNLLVLDIKYNLRNKRRSLSISSVDGDVLLPYTFLDYGRRCELNFNATQIDLNYYVTLLPKSKSFVYDKSYDFLNWSDNFDLCFVGNSFDLKERLNKNIRIGFVGN